MRGAAVCAAVQDHCEQLRGGGTCVFGLILTGVRALIGSEHGTALTVICERQSYSDVRIAGDCAARNSGGCSWAARSRGKITLLTLCFDRLRIVSYALCLRLVAYRVVYAVPTAGRVSCHICAVPATSCGVSYISLGVGRSDCRVACRDSIRVISIESCGFRCRITTRTPSSTWVCASTATTQSPMHLVSWLCVAGGQGPNPLVDLGWLNEFLGTLLTYLGPAHGRHAYRKAQETRCLRVCNRLAICTVLSSYQLPHSSCISPMDVEWMLNGC